MISNLILVPWPDLALFAGAALLMALTPGPNMLYTLSRSIIQGPKAGVISLAGVMVGFLVHMFAAALGLTALFVTVPFAYDLVKWAGAAYLGYLAWQALKPGARSPFEPRPLPPDPAPKLFVMGFLTNVLNPKIAVFYLSVFPQFVVPARGSVFLQSIVLGVTQIAASFSVNLTVALCAGTIAGWFARNRRWMAVQRYLMGFVLGGLALRLALDQRRS